MSRSKADAIREMSDSELADYLCDVISDCETCIANDYCYTGHRGFIDWLKEDEE